MTQVVYMSNPSNTSIQFDTRQSWKTSGWVFLTKLALLTALFVHVVPMFFPPPVQGLPLREMRPMFTDERETSGDFECKCLGF